jgi:hypothetical protein
MRLPFATLPTLGLVACATALTASQADAAPKKRTPPTYEVTDVSWSMPGILNVVVSASRGGFVACRVEQDGRPIGSGSGVAHAGVATVMVIVPDKYSRDPSGITVSCVPG